MHIWYIFRILLENKVYDGFLLTECKGLFQEMAMYKPTGYHIQIACAFLLLSFMTHETFLTYFHFVTIVCVQ